MIHSSCGLYIGCLQGEWFFTALALLFRRYYSTTSKRSSRNLRTKILLACHGFLWKVLKMEAFFLVCVCLYRWRALEGHHKIRNNNPKSPNWNAWNSAFEHHFHRFFFQATFVSIFFSSFSCLAIARPSSSQRSWRGHKSWEHCLGSPRAPMVAGDWAPIWGWKISLGHENGA